MKPLHSSLVEGQPNFKSDIMISRFQQGSKSGALHHGGTTQFESDALPSTAAIDSRNGHFELFKGSSEKPPVFRIIHGFSPADSKRGIGCLSSVKNLAISSPFNIHKSSSLERQQGSKVPLELKYAAAAISHQSHKPHSIELAKKLNSNEPPGYFGALRLDKDSRVQRLMAKHDSTRRFVRRLPKTRVQHTHVSSLEAEFGDMLESDSQYMNNTVGGKLAAPDPGTLRSLANQRIDTQSSLAPLDPHGLQHTLEQRLDAQCKLARLSQPSAAEAAEMQHQEPQPDYPRASVSESRDSAADWTKQGKSNPLLGNKPLLGVYQHNAVRTAPMLPPTEPTSRDREILQLRAFQQRGADFPDDWKKYSVTDGIAELTDRSEGVGLRGEIVFVKVAKPSNKEDAAVNNHIGTKDYESKDLSSDPESLELRTHNLAEIENLRVTLLESIIRGQEAPQLQKLLINYVSEKNQTDYCEIPIQELQEIDLAKYPRWEPPSKKLQAGSFFTETGYQTSGVESSDAMIGSVAEYQRLLKRELYS